MRHQPTIDTDVCVIGAGIMGLFAAWHLSQRALRVICIEQAASGFQATAATAGTLAVQNKQVAAVPLVMRSIRMWQQLSSEIGFDVEYERRGGLRVAQTAEEVGRLEGVTNAHRAVGAPIEMIYAPQVFGLAPYLSRRVQAASYCAEDGMANPFAAVRGLERACRSAGVRFELNTPVTDVQERPDGTLFVRSAATTFVCRAAIVAAGAWIPKLLAPFNVHLPIVTRVQQVLITDTGPALFPHILTHVQETLTLKQQRLSGKVLVGGGWTGEGDRDSGVRRLVHENVLGNVQMALTVVPSLAQARLLRGWTGFEGRTPDRLPVLGPVREGSSLHVLGCASGGFTLAPVCGQIAADMVTGETCARSYEQFLVGRFTCGTLALNPDALDERTVMPGVSDRLLRLRRVGS